MSETYEMEDISGLDLDLNIIVGDMESIEGVLSINSIIFSRIPEISFFP